MTKEREANTGLPALDYTPWLHGFLHHEIVGPVLLLTAAVAAMLTVNLGGAEWYEHFWHQDLGLALGERTIVQSLHHWVNDGLMAIFFFVVGLEIKRELLAGELATRRKALLPAAAALGGMLGPALVYLSFNFGGEGQHGWGIPMATDIAFAAGCLALLKGRVSPALMVFLTALAIVDDLGAVAVIALFYTDTIHVQPLLIGATLIIFSFILGQFGVRAMWPYGLVGLIVWAAFLQSGIHATVAGVLLALSIPHTARYETHNFAARMRTLLHRFDDAEREWDKEGRKPIQDVIVNSRQQALLRSMLDEVHHVEAPLQRLERNLEPLIVFIVLPLFAFANAGVQIDWVNLGYRFYEPVTLGAFVGLVAGKPVGVFLVSWLVVKAGFAELPRGVTWFQMFGVGMLAGIGFTMSLFVNGLAFVGSEPSVAERLAVDGKVGVFLASIVSAVLGLAFLRIASGRGAVRRRETA